MKDILIAAALVIRNSSETLLVRKRGTTAFLQPGGKMEPGETAELALIRELQEELGLTVAASRLKPLGRFEAQAANEPGARVVAEVFQLEIGDDDTVEIAVEIETAKWISIRQGSDIPMAPLTEHVLIPLCRQIF